MLSLHDDLEAVAGHVAHEAGPHAFVGVHRRGRVLVFVGGERADRLHPAARVGKDAEAVVLEHGSQVRLLHLAHATTSSSCLPMCSVYAGGMAWYMPFHVIQSMPMYASTTALLGGT